MWVYYMEEALRDRPEHRLPEPPGVVRMWVDRETGRPTMAGAPGAVFEAFLDGHLPDASTLDVDDGVGAESMDPTTSEDSLF
jgi:penicillin-binding protein 1A